MTILILELFLILPTLCQIKASNPENGRKLIVISMDGLMSREVQPNVMPSITEFYKSGVYCPQLQPVFPTKTFVNHFSIATGTLEQKATRIKQFIIYARHVNLVSNHLLLLQVCMLSRMAFSTRKFTITSCAK